MRRRNQVRCWERPPLRRLSYKLACSYRNLRCDDVQDGVGGVQDGAGDDRRGGDCSPHRSTCLSEPLDR